MRSFFDILSVEFAGVGGMYDDTLEGDEDEERSLVVDGDDLSGIG